MAGIADDILREVSRLLFILSPDAVDTIAYAENDTETGKLFWLIPSQFIRKPANDRCLSVCPDDRVYYFCYPTNISRFDCC